MDLYIDFAFFNKMRSKLLSPFNIDDLDSSGDIFYTEARLNFLYNTRDLLESEYCSEGFRETINAFFASNPGRFERKVTLIQHKDSSNLFMADILRDYSTRDAAKEFIGTCTFEHTTYPDGTTKTYMLFPDRHCIQKDILLTKIEELYSNYELSKYITSDLLPYYHEWLKVTKQYSYHQTFDSLLFIADVCGSIFTLNKLLESLVPAPIFGLLFEQISNSGWGLDETSEKIFDTEREEAIIRKLISLKGIEGYSLFIKSKALSATAKNKFFDIFEENEVTISPEENFLNFQENVYNELTKGFILKEEYILSAKEKGFDLDKFKSLALKYKMPISVAEMLFEKDFAKFQTYSTKIQEILTRKTGESAGASAGAGSSITSGHVSNELFRFQVEYEKNGKKAKKTYSVEIMPKTDPTALFIGKMLGCCQFYTGFSSKFAVVPVYTDENTGLIVLRDIADKNKIKAASFVWLGVKDGKTSLVLDSFEHLFEVTKCFAGFVSNLADILLEKDIDLYVGTGGKTPSLPISTERRPDPISPDLKICHDSLSVYKIHRDSDVQIKQVFYTSHNVSEYVIKVLTEMQKGEVENYYSIEKLMIKICDILEALPTLAEIINKATETKQDIKLLFANLYDASLEFNNYRDLLYIVSATQHELLTEKESVIEFIKEIRGSQISCYKITNQDYIDYKLSEKFAEEVLSSASYFDRDVIPEEEMKLMGEEDIDSV